MKCRACDCILTDIEAVRKDEHDEFIDLCSQCSIDVQQDLEYYPVIHVDTGEDNDD